jgi:hypothetical protein
MGNLQLVRGNPGQGMLGTADYSAGRLGAPVVLAGSGSPGPRNALGNQVEGLRAENSALRTRMAAQDRRLAALEEALAATPLTLEPR